MGKERIIIVFLIVFSLNPLYAQFEQSHSVVISFLQLKDKFNLGMVFNGVQLEYRYGLTWHIGGAELTYEPKLAFGIGWNREMTGYQAFLAPINVSWIGPVYNQNGHMLKAGANLATNYGYQMYPDLRGGHLFWMSEIGPSPCIKYSYQWDQKRIVITAQNSLLGFVSHTQDNDPYFYSFKAGDFFVKPPQEYDVWQF
jgi:hypothetical protein